MRQPQPSLSPVLRHQAQAQCHLSALASPLTMLFSQVFALSLLSLAASLPSYADLALSSTSKLGCSPNFPFQCPNDPSTCCSGSTGCCDDENTCSWSYTCGNLCQNRACTCSTDASCLATYNVYGATRYCCGGTCQNNVCPAPAASPSPLPKCCSAQCGGSKNVCSGQCLGSITQCQCTGACTEPFTQCIANACSAGSSAELSTTTIYLIIVGSGMGLFGVVFLIWYFSCRASRLSTQAGAQSGAYQPAPQAYHQGMQPAAQAPPTFTHGAYQQAFQPGYFQASQPGPYPGMQPAALAPPTFTQVHQQAYQAYHPAPQPGPSQGMQPAAQPPLTFIFPRKEQQPLLPVGSKTSV